MLNKYKQFIFKSYTFDQKTGQACFNYSLDDQVEFTETLGFDLTEVSYCKVNWELLDRILFNLHLVLGASYWKTYCPSQMKIESGELTAEQAKWWEKLYTKGMGEFFFVNKLDWHGLINFPVESKTSLKPLSVNLADKVLVPIGGGKDSVVTIEMLKAQGRQGRLFSVKDYKVLQGVIPVTGWERSLVTRAIAPTLFELNEQGSFNGHVPRSAINAWIALAQAVLLGYKEIVFSFEKSASSGNVEYLGEKINHQYTKSDEFEQDLQQYIKEYLSPDLKLHSLLRQMSELEIIEKFCEYPQYFEVFSSCNGNFTEVGQQSQRWCCHCPKCLFVFVCMSAFLNKIQLVKIFGANLYEDESLIPLLKSLMGLGEHKPFECVGTKEEMMEALSLAYVKGEFNNDALMKFYESIK